MKLTPRNQMQQINQNSFKSQGTQPSLPSKVHLDDSNQCTYEYQHNNYPGTSAFQTYYFTNNLQYTQANEQLLVDRKTINKTQKQYTIDKFKQANLKAKKVMQNIFQRKYYTLKGKEDSKNLSNTFTSKLKKKVSKQKFIKAVNSKKNKYCDQLVNKAHRQSEKEKNFCKNRIKSKSLQKRKRLNTFDKNKKFNRTNSLNLLKKKQKFWKIDQHKPKDLIKNRQIKKVQKTKKIKIPQKQKIYINSIKKICAILCVYRETCQLACYYYQKLQELLKQKKDKEILLFSAILVALKMSQSSMGKIFIEQISKYKQPHIYVHRKSHSLQSNFPKSKKQVFLQKFNDKKKIKNRILKHFNKIPAFLQNYQYYIPKKQQIINMQILICKQLDFRLNFQTLSSFIDNITISWDYHIIKNYNKNKDFLVVRSNCYNRKYSYLVQIMEIYTYLKQQRNYLCSIISTLYLIIRIESESRKKSYFEIVKNFKNSQNFIFTDQTGINQIFSQFIQAWDVEFQQLMKYCHQIIPLFQNQNLRIYDYNCQDKNNYDQSLNVYRYNQKLFQI